MLLTCADERSGHPGALAAVRDDRRAARPEDVRRCRPRPRHLLDLHPGPARRRSGRLGLEVGDLAGGDSTRPTVGDPPDLYTRIGPGFEELEALGAVDRSRPLIEFYRRHDQVELWLPVADGA